MGWTDIVFERTKVLLAIDKELREVEDEYLEAWLEEGLPDNCTIGEIVDFCDDDTDYFDLINLGFNLIVERR